MTSCLGGRCTWIPAKAGIHLSALVMSPAWVPASAGTRTGSTRA
jgi:hypothetical protein